MVALHLLANAHTVGYNDTIMTSNTGKFDFSLLQADCYNFLFIGFIFLRFFQRLHCIKESCNLVCKLALDGTRVATAPPH